MKKKQILAVIMIAGISGLLLIHQQLRLLPPEMLAVAIKQIGSEQMLIFVGTLQIIVMTLIAYVIGLWLAPKVELNKRFSFDQPLMIKIVFISFIVALLNTGLEKVFFQQYIGESEPYRFSFTYFIASLMYGGIIEEILLRLGVLTFITWVVQTLTKRTENRNYVIAIVLSSLIFALGHLPAASMVFGLTPVIIIRIIVLNFIPGLLFGWIFWKHGLIYSMLSHMFIHIFTQLVFLPIMF